MSEPVVIEPFMQKAIADCTVACLKMITGLSYEQVVSAFPKRAKVTENGVKDRQLVNAAKKLGFPLKWLPKADLSDVVGILDLEREDESDCHSVIIAKNTIYNPATGTWWTDIDAYFKTHKWKPLGVWVRTT